jgi:hypothetical protein
MHNLFTSCQVCHTREVNGQKPTRFGWEYLETAELGPSPDMKGEAWGEYGAKIVPILGTGDDSRPVTLAEEEAAAAELQRGASSLSGQQRNQLNKLIHRRCAENPVLCGECHNPAAPLLPFADLGYSTERAAFLVSAEVVDMVQRYEEFHLPKLLNSFEKNGTKTQERPQ